MEPTEDLAKELYRLLRMDDSVLHKNHALVERLVVACVDELSGGDGLVWHECKKVLRGEKQIKTWEPKIIKRARAAMGIPSIGTPSSSTTTIRTHWTDAPVSSDAIVPPGWGVGDPNFEIYKSIWKKVDGERIEQRLLVSLSPILITKRIQAEDHTMMLEISWRTGKHWHSASYPRDVISDTRSLVKTSVRGVPVSSANAAALVEYLQAYEHHNLTTIARGYMTHCMGWKGSAEDPTHDGFMCGTKQIGGNGRAIEVMSTADGDDEDISSVTTGGSFEEWTEAMKIVADWPVIKLMVFASLAAPLLVPLRAPNMIVESVGPTTGGKTTGMRIAQSCWRPGSFPIQTWNNTVNGFEAKAHVNTDMPLFIDDTKTAIDQGKGSSVAKVIYQHVSGRGRGRAARDGGQRATQIWRSIMISTGEVQSSDLAKAEGAATRVLSMWSNPTGKTSPDTAKKIDKIEKMTSHSFGHAGRMMVKWLCDNRSKWPQLIKHYEQVATSVREEFGSAAASRLAKVIAILEVSAYVAVAAKIVPWSFKPLLEDERIRKVLAESIAHATSASTLAKSAWEDACSYAKSRRNQWLEWGEPEQEDRPDPKATPDHERPGEEENDDTARTRYVTRVYEPPQGWLGWSRSDPDRPEITQYAWEPPQLRRALKDLGYGEYTRAILQLWRSKGVLTATGSRFTSPQRCGRTIGTEAKVHHVCLISDDEYWWTYEPSHDEEDEYEILQ